MGKVCMEVETGALIFAILNVMSHALGTVLSIVGFAYTTMIADGAMRQASEMGDERMTLNMIAMGMATNIVFAILVVGFSISLSFAIVLIVGLCKRKANLVKCFFVYGVMKLVVLFAFMLVVIISADGGPAVLLLIIGGAIHGLILHMIRCTYLKFQSEVPFNSFSNPLAATEKL